MAGKKILIADDDQDCLELFSFMLKKAGYEVITVSSGLEALEKLDDITPDLVILDVMMNEMDGFTALKNIKRYDETKDIPVIILTNYPKMENAFRSENVDDYILKVTDKEEFLKRVEKVLQKRSEQTEKPSPETPQ
ncbi:MAG: response regulator [Candidatus Omnitrophica bacterium]|nr:response regulator [Candidatus Omnitrophota bacterium]MCK4424014.1 response regulator [Candidatus Omnitrophota bacterium]